MRGAMIPGPTWRVETALWERRLLIAAALWSGLVFVAAAVFLVRSLGGGVLYVAAIPAAVTATAAAGLRAAEPGRPRGMFVGVRVALIGLCCVLSLAVVVSFVIPAFATLPTWALVAAAAATRIDQPVAHRPARP